MGDKTTTSHRNQILVDSAVETKFHGLLRTVGDRHPLVKLLWFLAFLALVGLLLKLLYEAAVKMNGMPVTTSVEPNEVAFEFPDIHFCSYPIVSASYPSAMPAAARNYTTRIMDSIKQLLGRINVSATKYPVSQAFVGTIPYRFFSDNFGMRKEQSVIKATVLPMNIDLQLETDIVDLKHFKYLNCFTLRPQRETLRKLLGNVLSSIDITLFSDVSYNQTFRIYDNLIDVRGLSFFYFEDLLSSGFRMYFTPQGTYPDDYSSYVTVSPGYTHHVKLGMQVRELSEEKGQCQANNADVQFLNQATLQPASYTYNLQACYGSQLIGWFNSTMKSYLPGIFPLPYAYRDVPCAYNFSRFNANSSSAEILGLYDFMRSHFNGSTAADTVRAIGYMQAACRGKSPCSEIAYKASLSSIKAPLKQSMMAELSSLLRPTAAALARQNYSTPGRDWLLALLDRATAAAADTNSSAAAEANTNLAHAVAENVLRVQIRSGEVTSTRISQSVTYKLFDLAVEVGGLMSLFIGGSILTLVELVEFLVCMLWGRKLEPQKVGDDSRVVTMVQPQT